MKMNMRRRGGNVTITNSASISKRQNVYIYIYTSKIDGNKTSKAITQDVVNDLAFIIKLWIHMQYTNNVFFTYSQYGHNL